MKVEELMDQLRNLQEAYDAAKLKMQQVTKEAKEMKLRLQLANRMLSGLTSESTWWEAEVQRLSRLIGNVHARLRSNPN